MSGIPTTTFGVMSLVWFGTTLFMVIEGTMMAMLFAAYFYLRTRSPDWPPSLIPPPDWRWGIGNAALFLVSAFPAWLIKGRARARDLVGVRRSLGVLLLFATGNIVLRVMEFIGLNCRWSDNAYASVIWVMLGTHSGHLATEFIETAVLLALAWKGTPDESSYEDFFENSDYWYFVVGLALLMDLVLYAAPHLL